MEFKMSLLITLACIALGVYIAQQVLAVIFGGIIGARAFKSLKENQ
jgi:hypothetical protein